MMELMTIWPQEQDAKREVINWSFEKSYRPQNLFVRRLMDQNFSHIEIWNILQAIDSICLKCFDKEHPCSCKYK